MLFCSENIGQNSIFSHTVTNCRQNNNIMAQDSMGTGCHKTRAYGQLGELNYCPYFNVDKGDDIKIRAPYCPYFNIDKSDDFKTRARSMNQAKKFYCLYFSIDQYDDSKIRATKMPKNLISRKKSNYLEIKLRAHSSEIRDVRSN